MPVIATCISGNCKEIAVNGASTLVICCCGVRNRLLTAISLDHHHFRQLPSRKKIKDPEKLNAEDSVDHRLPSTSECS